MKDAVLDMRMDQSQEFQAATVVNTYKEEELLNIFYKYAEEPRSKDIVRGIIKARENK